MASEIIKKEGGGTSRVGTINEMRTPPFLNETVGHPEIIEF
jgi:hypothetical protein